MGWSSKHSGFQMFWNQRLWRQTANPWDPFYSPWAFSLVKKSFVEVNGTTKSLYIPSLKLTVRPWKSPSFLGFIPSKWWIFQPAMLVYRRVLSFVDCSTIDISSVSNSKTWSATCWDLLKSTWKDLIIVSCDSEWVTPSGYIQCRKIMHRPNSKGKSWVPIGGYPRYIPIYSTYIWVI